MAKEVLAVPEYMLQEVIEIITHGIAVTRGRTDIQQKVRDFLEKWCDEEQEYLNRLREMKDFHPKVLTGRELKVAAKKGLKVTYYRYSYNSLDPEVRWTGIMEKAKTGYYIADEDIDPEDFSDDEKMSFDVFESYVTIYSVKGVNYEL